MKTHFRNLLNQIVLASLATVVVLAAADVASACPSCQAALASQEGGQRVVQGFFWSILFMMSMPFSILTGLSTYFYFLVRRARRENAVRVAVPTTNQAAAQRARDAGR
jgi:heme/copper-type cytochrome/quinol oxidase subunit 2